MQGDCTSAGCTFCILKGFEVTVMVSGIKTKFAFMSYFMACMC